MLMKIFRKYRIIDISVRQWAPVRWLQPGPDVFLRGDGERLQDLQQRPAAVPGDPGLGRRGRGQVRRDAFQVRLELCSG